MFCALSLRYGRSPTWVQWQRNKSLKSGERTLRLIAMWLKSTGWISPIKTKARRGFILSQGIKMWHAAFSLFLLSLPSCSRKVSQKNLADWGESRLRGVDSVTAVTKHCQLLLSHVYFDSATLKASASWSRCANLHNSEVYSVMPRRCYSCCALTPRHCQISPPVSERSLHKTETLRQRFGKAFARPSS